MSNYALLAKARANNAEMDLWVIVSNAGHPLDPSLAATPGPIDVMRYTVDLARDNDMCRMRSPEAARAFEITERHVRLRHAESAA